MGALEGYEILWSSLYGSLSYKKISFSLGPQDSLGHFLSAQSS